MYAAPVSLSTGKSAGTQNQERKALRSAKTIPSGGQGAGPKRTKSKTASFNGFRIPHRGQEGGGSLWKRPSESLRSRSARHEGQWRTSMLTTVLPVLRRRHHLRGLPHEAQCHEHREDQDDRNRQAPARRGRRVFHAHPRIATAFLASARAAARSVRFLRTASRIASTAA